jgi:hypothetical protein
MPNEQFFSNIHEYHGMNTFYKLISSTAGLFKVKIIFAQNNRVVLVLNMMKDEYNIGIIFKNR